MIWDKFDFKETSFIKMELEKLKVGLAEKTSGEIHIEIETFTLLPTSRDTFLIHTVYIVSSRLNNYREKLFTVIEENTLQIVRPNGDVINVTDPKNLLSESHKVLLSEKAKIENFYRLSRSAEMKSSSFHICSRSD